MVVNTDNKNNTTSWYSSSNVKNVKTAEEIKFDDFSACKSIIKYSKTGI